ncbi:hypothetical protein EVG20_g11585 [Dentipellis fragilis]|uniref:Uncharacterized protein n=1 Tax=Dentipellis fragilis TaxID=205917 RepID=A0A4Y9XK41_9AGAM|nr:hypothetical protein EVG20_g11585 [Dentipellis fragilis]
MKVRRLRPIQIACHVTDEGPPVAHVHCVAGEGLWQHPDYLEIEHADPAAAVEDEIARVHVGLGEDERVVAEIHRRWSRVFRDPLESLFRRSSMGLDQGISMAWWGSEL